MSKYKVVIIPKSYALGEVKDLPISNEEIMEAIGDRFYALSMKQIFDEATFKIEKRDEDE